MNILVTGVSKGLGLKICQTLLENDYKVYGVSRSTTTELKKLIKNYPDHLNCIEYDLSRIGNIKDTLFTDWISKETILHGYVNNAAIAYDDIISNLKIDQLKKMFDVNVFAPMLITKTILRKALLHDAPCSIVHISSISVHTGYKGLSMYASTKGSLEAFSKNTAREWGEKKIRSNCVVAGFMETEMSSSLTEEQKKRIYNRTSLKEQVNISSLAETIRFLISEKSKSITGQNLFVDNGTI